MRPTSAPVASSASKSAGGKYRQIRRCRICGNRNLAPVFDLGEQYLAGVSLQPSRGLAQLVKCTGDDPEKRCGLVQLRHSYSTSEMFGENYGYRSGLNRVMVEHLHGKADYLQNLVKLAPGDLVLDIGSNDGTLLARYPAGGSTLVGIDPSAGKFAKYYRQDIDLIVDFFSPEIFRKHFGSRRAKIVTSVGMFDDLERPQLFTNDITALLADGGVWHLEQRYLPSVLRTNSYDTACYEHMECYTLRQLDWMFRRAGLRIIDVKLNNINGGSLAVTVAAGTGRHTAEAERLLQHEAELGLDTLQPFEEYRRRVLTHRQEASAIEPTDIISHEGKTLCIIIHGAVMPEKTTFYTPNEFNLQVGKIVYPAGGEIPRHIHPAVTRTVASTSEVLVVQKGRMMIDLYTADRAFLCSREMTAGDVVVLMSGGHGFRLLEDTMLLEVKQGPYGGLREKEFF
ncbi:MAG: methyltransferase domain-containing protein [Xanthobacteraceae bacterium]